jgi:hypothetical protein
VVVDERARDILATAVTFRALDGGENQVIRDDIG